VRSRAYYRGQDDDRQRMATRGKGKKLNKAWLHDHLTDPYVKLAQREGYRARAAYKLKEIDEELKLLAPGQLVVDLGATPGAWSQYLRRKFGRGGGADPHASPGPLQGTIIALDMLDLEPIDGVDFIQGDFRDPEVLAGLEARVAGRPIDVVLSDMAPNLSGVAASDAARMADLVELAIDFAARHLRPDGALVCKVFHGSGYSQLVERFKSAFRTVKAVKPKASRAKSAETFLVGIALKPGASTRDLRA
jgi:23S rRNA (uridine2552-2'-O)-methyltransferase